jgi:methylated-DNA-[protein]-cysteine S-methyltransferase
MTYFTTFDSPLGEMLLIATAEGLTGAYFNGQKYFPARNGGARESPRQEWLAAAKRQFGEYFADRRKQFDLQLNPSGTPFQRRVWDALLTIPFGETKTYGELAANLGDPNATRAVAAAIGRNPISVIVPCHRVIGANGSLTGYAAGLGCKRALLELEGVLKKDMLAGVQIQ